jgi:hypothetical protein
VLENALKTKRMMLYLLALVTLVTSVNLVSGADFFIYNASLTSDNISVGETTDLSVTVYASSFHNCQVTVSSDPGVNILVPTREFSFGGTYTGGLFGETYYQSYGLDFQVVALTSGDHTLTVNYYVEGNLVDSREVTRMLFDMISFSQS